MSASDVSEPPHKPLPAASLRDRTVELVVTVLSLGTNKLVARGSGWLTRKGLTKYVLPALVLNESFGVYRAYLAAGAIGGW